MGNRDLREGRDLSRQVRVEWNRVELSYRLGVGEEKRFCWVR
jgi:hypothetical protein